MTVLGGSHLLSFMRIGVPSVLLEVTDPTLLSELGFETYDPGPRHTGWATGATMIADDRVVHRLSAESVELLDPEDGALVARWGSPTVRTWRVVVGQPTPIYVCFFARTPRAAPGEVVDEAVFRADIDDGRVLAGQIAPAPAGLVAREDL